MIAGMYWTHQLYNYCPIDDPKDYQAAGLHGSEQSNVSGYNDVSRGNYPKYPNARECYSSYINVLRANDSLGFIVMHHIM